MKTVALASLGLLLMFGNLSGQTTVWKSDKAHSHVKFSVSHMVIAEVSGRFKDFDVTLEQGKDDLSDAKLNAVIKTASIDTDNETRDKHLRSDDFLNAEKYPDMIFKSTSIEKTGTDTYKIHGMLTIRDVTKPVVLDTRFTGTVNDPWGNVRVGYKATTSIDRFDFGTKWKNALDNGSLIAGRNIEITLLMELTKQQQKSQG